MIYWIGRSIFRILFKLIFRLKVHGAENVPAGGPVIIAANHSSYADPPLVGSALARPLYFMAKKELFEVPVLGWLIKRTHAFPVDRGTADFAAMSSAKKMIESGRALLIFPEGTRKKPGRERKLKNGAAALAAMTGAPVVPAAIINSDRIFKLPRLSVRFGKPVKLEAGAGHDSATLRIMSEIDRLKGGG